jgi:hypothetical protein
MAKPLTAVQLIDALQKWHVDYELYDDWRTRTRPGGCNPIGFVQHHTGGPFTESASYLEFLFDVGRPSEGIPGPLCQFAIGPSGTVWVASLGRANQAGTGSSATRDKISSEDYPGYTSEIRPGADNVNGNGIYWGVEICYPGTVPMRQAQYASAVLLAAAIVDAFGWSALSILGHREHSRRKIDPGGVNLAKFRRDVRALLAAGPDGDQLPDTGSPEQPQPEPETPQEDPMAVGKIQKYGSDEHPKYVRFIGDGREVEALSGGTYNVLLRGNVPVMSPPIGNDAITAMFALQDQREDREQARAGAGTVLQTIGRTMVADGLPLTVGLALDQLWKDMRGDDVDEAALAAAVVEQLVPAIMAKLPSGTLTATDVKTALREVLGSLDEQDN